MTRFRHALAAGAIVAAVVPASSAFASSGARDMVRTLAGDAAELVAEEQQLVATTDPRNTVVSDVRRTDAEQRLRVVDAQGAAILRQLQQLDVDVTEAMRATLEPLPTEMHDAADEPAISVPDDIVYDAAINDLARIAATPEAVILTAERSGNPATGLIAVAALSLVALGAAALANHRRRHPEHDELAALAWSDGLTGLANRRRLDHDLGDYESTDASTSVIMVDVDHFESVNDSFGHRRGDEILQHVGAMLAREVRLGDYVYRYGGEEFCVLLPETTIAEATSIATRIVAAAREIELPDGAHLTVSVGVAASVEGDMATAMEIADRALFDAKDRGRDRAIAATPDRRLEPA